VTLASSVMFIYSTIRLLLAPSNDLAIEFMSGIDESLWTFTIIVPMALAIRIAAQLKDKVLR